MTFQLTFLISRGFWPSASSRAPDSFQPIRALAQRVNADGFPIIALRLIVRATSSFAAARPILTSALCVPPSCRSSSVTPANAATSCSGIPSPERSWMRSAVLRRAANNPSKPLTAGVSSSGASSSAGSSSGSSTRSRFLAGPGRRLRLLPLPVVATASSITTGCGWCQIDGCAIVKVNFSFSAPLLRILSLLLVLTVRDSAAILHSQEKYLITLIRYWRGIPG